MSFEAVRAHLDGAGIRYALIGGVAIALPRTSDLILLKLAAAGPRDLIDAVNLLKVNDRETIVAQLSALLPTLPAALQPRVTEFLQNNSSMA